MNKKLIEYVNSWLDKANHDLAAAQRLIEIEPVILDVGCFHCQQAIEKFLKAYLVFKGNDIKKTHSIDFLLQECAELDSDFKLIDPKNIEDYAVKGRYPDDSVMPSLNETNEYYTIATNVKLLVNKKVCVVE